MKLSVAVKPHSLLKVVRTLRPCPRSTISESITPKQKALVGGSVRGIGLSVVTTLSPTSIPGTSHVPIILLPGSNLIFSNVPQSTKISFSMPCTLLPVIAPSAILSVVTVLSANFGFVTAPSSMFSVPTGPCGPGGPGGPYSP